RTGPLELLVGGGIRATSVRNSTYQSWASGTAVLWVMRGAAIVVATGRALADVSRGVPSTRYLSAAIRFGGSSEVAPGTGVRVGRSRPDEDGGRIDVNVRGDSLRIVTVRLRSATTVELMADFTDWEPVSMAQLPNG